jgi:hypothetical protein
VQVQLELIQVGTPRPLFKDAVLEQTRRSALLNVRTGVMRELQVPLHNHDISCVETPEPLSVTGGDGAKKQFIEKDKHKSEFCRPYLRRLVFEYILGKRGAYSVKSKPFPRDHPDCHEFETAPLHFESRFEGGNLMSATQVADYDYDMELQWDVNTR